MARGRSIDKTLQPSRALAQQRDYRARKAARIVCTNRGIKAESRNHSKTKYNCSEPRMPGYAQNYAKRDLAEMIRDSETQWRMSGST